MNPRFRAEGISWVGFDADDTLWHNEGVFRRTQEKFVALLRHYHSEEWINRHLYQTEMRNLRTFGYGVKGFVLSMIETAIELTEGRIMGAEIQTIIDLARDMLEEPVQPLPGVRETLAELFGKRKLMLITKGDLFEQEGKVARSGLGDFFSRVEIVSEKTEETYHRIFRENGIKPGCFLMVGNSLKSDILPVLSTGAHAVYIPYRMTWQHEQVGEAELDRQAFVELEHIGQLRQVLP